MNPYKQCPSDTDTVESLALEIEELKGELSRVREFLTERLDACSCEHCGRILVRKHMLAPYGLDWESDGKPLPQSSHWFCGYCVYCGLRQLGRKSTQGPRTHRRMALARLWTRVPGRDGVAL